MTIFIEGMTQRTIRTEEWRLIRVISLRMFREGYPNYIMLNPIRWKFSIESKK